jgi:hypothetical protein
MSNVNHLPVFLRPIQIDSSSDSVSVGGSAVSLTTGVYPCIAAVLHNFDHVVDAAVPSLVFTITFSAGFKVVLSGSTTFAVTWTDTNLRDMLGFAGDLSGSSSYTATYTPQYCWVPTRSRADVNEWAEDQSNNWRGMASRSGAVMGLRTGDALYKTTFDFDALAGALLLKSQATTAIETVRCLEYFADHSRVAWSSVDLPTLAGFYVYPDRDNVALAASATWDAGDASTLSYASSPDVFLYCHFDASWHAKSRPAVQARTGYYDTSVTVHTATAPTWTGA